jgi:hypothetical protein
MFCDSGEQINQDYIRLRYGLSFGRTRKYCVMRIQRLPRNQGCCELEFKIDETVA